MLLNSLINICLAQMLVIDVGLCTTIEVKKDNNFFMVIEILLYND